MDNSKLKIFDNDTAIEMPKARYSLSAEEVSTETTVMSGKIVKDILGYRTVLNVEWDWVPADMLSKIVKLIRTGKFREVEYQDIDSTLKKEYFKISQPEPEVFTFKEDGTAIWRRVKLTMTAQEVTSND
ncbi:MAG: hypothetical protein MR908_00825 [Firmicutes bacterium]|nr:hypothetical protein [Bacillota bacterium]